MISPMYLLEQAIKCQTRAEAVIVLEEYVVLLDKISERQLSRYELEQKALSNIGYFAGYYEASVRERVEMLFGCAHPIFGQISVHGEPTQEEAFLIGFHMGAKIKELEEDKIGHTAEDQATKE